MYLAFDRFNEVSITFCPRTLKVLLCRLISSMPHVRSIPLLITSIPAKKNHLLSQNLQNDMIRTNFTISARSKARLIRVISEKVQNQILIKIQETEVQTFTYFASKFQMDNLYIIVVYKKLSIKTSVRQKCKAVMRKGYPFVGTVASPMAMFAKVDVFVE